jgi:hypothetical protein
MAETRRLSSAAKRASGQQTRMRGSKAANAKKLADVVATTPSTKPSASSSLAPKAELSENSVVVPGLLNLTPETTAAVVPQFNGEEFNIPNLYAPPESMPQMSDAERDRLIGINNGAQNALDVAQSSLVTIEKRFNVEGQHAKTIGAGIKASNEVGKTVTLYQDYQSTLEIIKQKGIQYQVNQFKTASDQVKAGYTMSEISDKEEQARINAEKASDETTKKRNEMLEAKSRIGVLPNAD